MRRLAATSSLILLLFQFGRLHAQQLSLVLQRQNNQTFTLLVIDRFQTNGHTFVEFSTNGVWYPAFFINSEVPGTPSFTVTNTGAVKMFRATQAPAIANRVKASWQRLGVTNYVFRY